MKKYFYPAFIRRVETGGFSVDFPDLPGCVSAGDTLEESVTMAKEALSLHLFGMVEDGDAIPEASDPSLIPHEEGAFVALVDGIPDMIRDVVRNRSVKKTLTIPNWLNEEAERHHINFSQALQESLKEKIGVL